MLQQISYKLEKPSKLNQYTLKFIFDCLGVIGKEKKAGKVDLYYGSREKNHHLIIEPNQKDLIWPALIKGKKIRIQKFIPFDLIGAIGQLMSDQIHRNLPREAYDRHDRLKEDYSLQFKKNVNQSPIVNLYLEFFKKLFKKNLQASSIEMWPENKKCVIGLSHDVDIPDKYAALYLAAEGKNQRIIYRAKLIGYLRRLFDRHPDDFFLFDDIMNSEEKLGFRSTFFFAAENLAGNHGSPFDVHYDIRREKFGKVFQTMRQKGFEIGLHAGYNAYLNGENFILEKDKLEKYAHQKIKGLRHHFWHLGKDEEKTLLEHEKAGFKYDSSIAFNNVLGFRRNIALPYYPWSFRLNRPIKVLQQPVFCMDSCLFHNRESVDEAFKNLKKYLKIIKSYQGIGVVDWHVRTSYPKNRAYRTWGQTYLKMLEYLAGDREIWVTSLENIYDWVKSREEKLAKK